MFYRVLWEQLPFAESMKILDFGSGFGITANFLAAANDVTAVEPNEEMCNMRFKEHTYLQIHGGMEALERLPADNYDLVICHNVLEYIDYKDNYVAALVRLLKTGGKLSLVKHNHPGRVMQKIVHENNLEQALQLLGGESMVVQNFGKINYYGKSDVESWMENYSLRQLDWLGIRTFFALHPDNSIRLDKDWTSSMFALEMKASSMEEFINIAFFNHIILEKK